MALCSLLIRRKDRKQAGLSAIYGRPLLRSPFQSWSGKCLPGRRSPKDGSYVNPGEGLYPEYAYLQMDKTPEMELVYRNEMKPTWEDFGSFCHNMHCTSSHRNRNIADILEEIESKDRKLLELSKQGTASDIRQQIEETGQDKALLDKLLKQYYDVRGHRTVGNILRDPMECVTVDGVRLFTPHRQVLAAGHGLFLPGEAKATRPMPMHG